MRRIKARASCVLVVALFIRIRHRNNLFTTHFSIMKGTFFVAFCKMRRWSTWAFLIKVGHSNFLLNRKHVRRTFATK